MQVRAKMRVTEITKAGDAKKPFVRVKLGAVYSSDPQSENKSFASATPSGSVELNIDAGRPAAAAFQLQQEFYVDFTPIGVPERIYLGDYGFVEGEVIVESRDRTRTRKLIYDMPHGSLYEPDNREQRIEVSKLIAEGFEFWRHPKDGE